MDEFLKTLAIYHIWHNKEFNDFKELYINNIEAGIRELLSEDMYEEFIDDVFAENINEIIEGSFAAGMKMAMEIIDKRYEPTI